MSESETEINNDSWYTDTESQSETGSSISDTVIETNSETDTAHSGTGSDTSMTEWWIMECWVSHWVTY